MYTIRDLFNTLYPFRESLMHSLTATDLATFCYSTKIELSEQERSKYLVPIRDLPQQEEWIRNWVKGGNRLTIMGKDIPVWFERIKNPHLYWAKYTNHITIRVWIIVPPSVKDTDERRSRIDSMHDYLLREWTLATNADDSDIEDWHQAGPFSWNTMTDEHHRVIDQLGREYKQRPGLVQPPGEWGTFFDLEMGYGRWNENAIRNESGDAMYNKGWSVLLNDNREPIEVMNLDMTMNARMWTRWVPSHLVHHDSESIRTCTISVSPAKSEFKEIVGHDRFTSAIVGSETYTIIIPNRLADANPNMRLPLLDIPL
jgi:hypothetical protein